MLVEVALLVANERLLLRLTLVLLLKLVLLELELLELELLVLLLCEALCERELRGRHGLQPAPVTWLSSSALR